MRCPKCGSARAKEIIEELGCQFNGPVIRCGGQRKYLCCFDCLHRWEGGCDHPTAVVIWKEDGSLEKIICGKCDEDVTAELQAEIIQGALRA